MCYHCSMVSRVRAWVAAHPRWSTAAIVVIAALAIAYGALAWKTSLQPDRLASVDRLVEQFGQVIFRVPPEGEFDQRIEKWTRRVRIRIVGDDAGKWRPVIERHMATFADLAGIDLFPMFLLPMTVENYFIYFAEKSEFEKLVIRHIEYPGTLLENLEDYNCFAYNPVDSLSIHKAVLIISSELGDHTVSFCIFKRLTQLLGFNNDSELIRPSVFSHWDWKLRDLSINDRIIIRTLYDKRMKVGMHREEALEVARRIITELVVEAKANEAASGD